MGVERGTPVYDSARGDVGPIRESVRDVYRYRDLLRLLIGTNVKMRYKRSVLGVAWTLLNPLATAIVMTIAFSALFRFALPNYAVYVLSGILYWTFFQQGTTHAMSSLVWGGGLLTKVYVPAAVFPLSAIGTALVNLVLSMPPLVLIMLALRHEFSPALLFLPVPVLLLAAFSLGVGLIMSSYAIFFSDVVEMYGVALRVWFYLTPIMYPETILPDKVLWVVKLNPMYHLVSCWRAPIYNGELPPAGSVAAAAVWATAALVVGAWIFTRRADQFALRA